MNRFNLNSGRILLSLLMFWGMASLSAQGVQAPDGTVAFEAGIKLLGASTTFNAVRVRQAKYYFDIELPSDIGEPLGKLVIHQRRGGEQIKFKPERTRAYLGEERNDESALALVSKQDPETSAITIQFDPPIAPGNRVTVGLKPKRNPDFGGVYLFGVTAFPAGAQSQGLYLGPGRLHFFQNDGFFFH